MAPDQHSRPRSRRAAADGPAQDPNPGHICAACGKRCKTAGGLKSHERSAHPPPIAAVHSERIVPTAPDGLGPSGGRIWRSIVESYELRPDELRILEDACREALLIDRLDRELEGLPLLVKGSMGQLVANPIVQELRQHRSTFAQLMSRLKLPDDPDDASRGVEGERATKARAAANARWRRGP